MPTQNTGKLALGTHMAVATKGLSRALASRKQNVAAVGQRKHLLSSESTRPFLSR